VAFFSPENAFTSRHWVSPRELSARRLAFSAARWPVENGVAEEAVVGLVASLMLTAL
jgi:hypothetical protein